MAQDCAVVNTGVDDGALAQMRFVFFTLFDGALVLVEIGHDCEALNSLRGEIAVGHGMANHDRLPAIAAKF